MKKVVIALCSLLVLNVAAFAQAVPASTKKVESKLKVVPPPTAQAKSAMVVPMPKSIPNSSPKTTAKTTTAVVLKKDGTPDKRFNNTATTAPLKKDGTPDKRFKKNK